MVSWVRRVRSSRKLSETNSPKANDTLDSRISVILATATAFCRSDSVQFRSISFYLFIFFSGFVCLDFGKLSSATVGFDLRFGNFYFISYNLQG